MISEELRKALNVIFKDFSNKEIAYKLGVDVTTVAKLRTGNMNMTEKNALRICKAFGYRINCSFRVVKM